MGIKIVVNANILVVGHPAVSLAGHSKKETSSMKTILKGLGKRKMGSP